MVMQKQIVSLVIIQCTGFLIILLALAFAKLDIMMIGKTMLFAYLAIILATHATEIQNMIV